MCVCVCVCVHVHVRVCVCVRTVGKVYRPKLRSGVTGQDLECFALTREVLLKTTCLE